MPDSPTSRPDLARLTSPRWLLSHVLVVALAATMVALGLWQLRRLDERQAQNALVAARLEQAPVPVTDLDAATPAEATYRRVTATGTYRPDEEVLQRSRAHAGQNGYHVLTPLDLGDGTGILVRRGWVPFELDTPPVAEAAPPDAGVTVTGFLQPSEPQPGFGARDPAEGTLERVFRADVERIQPQVSVELLPWILQLEAQDPGQPGRLPIPAEPPEFDEGNHLSYAIQWFSFAAIAVVGYGAFLRSRQRSRSMDASAAKVAARSPSP